MAKTKVTHQQDLPESITVTNYVVGFLLAVVLTIIAYLIVVNNWLEGGALVAAVMGLASVQLVVQLVFFLHLGHEAKPRWNSAVFWFMLMTLVILVAGSLWIMYNLNYNMMMSPEEMNQYMLEQNQKGF